MPASTGRSRKQIGTEPVYRADLRFFELPDGVVQATALSRIGRGFRARIFELLAQAQLQLTGSFLGERYAGDLGNIRPAGFDHPHDSTYELRRLTSACRGLDDQGRIEIVFNQIPLELVSKLLHGRPRNSIKSAISFFDFRLARRSCSGPQTGRKSHH